MDWSRAFEKGSRSYDSRLSRWWISKSRDRAHASAYLKIARYMQAHLKQPRFIIDYAGGNGEGLLPLLRIFPQTNFVLIDGSERMLASAAETFDSNRVQADRILSEKVFQHHGPQVRLVHSALPGVNLRSGKADAAMLLFPNMNFSKSESRLILKRFNRFEVRQARFLSRLKDEQRRRWRTKIEKELLEMRAVAIEIHRLLKKNGLWFKVDYSNARREDFPKETLWKLLFSEYAFKTEEKGIRSGDSFYYIKNQYFASSVSCDVYEQTGHPADLEAAGFFLSLFRK